MTTEETQPNPRVEVVARAMAKYRLGHSQLAIGLPTSSARAILERAVEKLWPSLVEEASAIVTALEAEQSHNTIGQPVESMTPPLAHTDRGEESVEPDESEKRPTPNGHFEGL